MRFRSLVVSVAFVLYGIVFTAPHEVAHAASSQPPGLGPAIGALVVATAVANGFNPADPRIGETVAAMGRTAASIAAGIAAAGGVALGSVSWLAVGIGAGLAIVPTTLGKDTLDQWQLNHDGTVTITPGGSGGSGSSGTGSGGTSGASPFPALVNGGGYWSGPGCSGGSAEGAAQACMQMWDAGATWDIHCNSAGSCTGSVSYPNGLTGSPSFSVSQQSNWQGGSCASGLFYSGACQAYLPPPDTAPPPSGPVTESLAQAIAGLDADDLNDELNPYLLAAATNALWAQAAEAEGYAGLPFPVNAPATTSQAGSIEGQFGSGAPTVGSVAGGAGSLGGVSGSAPFDTTPPAASNPASSVPVATNPGTGDEVNLGPDPGIGAPGLEATPTAQQILAPVLGMLPDLRNYGMPAHTAQCPEPSITLFDTTITVTTQCQLAEQFRPQIYVTFVLAFSLAALFIVLTA
jgi:hypothetical protein